MNGSPFQLSAMAPIQLARAEEIMRTGGLLDRMSTLEQLGHCLAQGRLLLAGQIVEMQAAATARLALRVAQDRYGLEAVMTWKGDAEGHFLTGLHIGKHLVDHESDAADRDIHDRALDFDEPVTVVNLHVVIGSWSHSDVFATFLHLSIIGCRQAG